MGGSNSKPRRRVAVLGGGPAGLTAAYCLLHDNDDVAVDIYEDTGRFGGAIISETGGGFRYDLGPNAMNTKHPAVHHLLHKRLQLTGAIVPRQSARRFLIVKDGTPHVLPSTPRAFLLTPLLSARAKFRLLAEPFVPRLRNSADADAETVAAFFDRRFGAEVTTALVDPALAGIYSASPRQLSMKHALPALWNTERTKGSVIGGALRGVFARAKKLSRDKNSNAASSQLLQQQQQDGKGETAALTLTRKDLMSSFSYTNGMSQLPETLEAAIRATPPERRSLRANARVHRIDRDVNGLYRISVRPRRRRRQFLPIGGGGGSSGGYSAVVSTIPPHALDGVSSNIPAISATLARLSRGVSYAPVSVAVLGFENSQLPGDVYGYGALVPSGERRASNILGVNFTSAGFPARLTDATRTFWTVYAGGSRRPDVAARADEDVTALATRELRALFGVKGSPAFARVRSWPHGIPIYGVGYDKVLCAMARVEAATSGAFVLAGNYRSGVGVPDALLSGIQAAEKVGKHLGTL